MRLIENKEAAFEDVFKECSNKIHAVFIFLALLELIQLKSLFLRVGEGKNNFWIANTKQEDETDVGTKQDT